MESNLIGTKDEILSKIQSQKKKSLEKQQGKNKKNRDSAGKK